MHPTVHSQQRGQNSLWKEKLGCITIRLSTIQWFPIHSDRQRPCWDAQALLWPVDQSPLTQPPSSLTTLPPCSPNSSRTGFLAVLWTSQVYSHFRVSGLAVALSRMFFPPQIPANYPPHFLQTWLNSSIPGRSFLITLSRFHLLSTFHPGPVLVLLLSILPLSYSQIKYKLLKNRISIYFVKYCIFSA